MQRRINVRGPIWVRVCQLVTVGLVVDKKGVRVWSAAQKVSRYIGVCGGSSSQHPLANAGSLLETAGTILMSLEASTRGGVVAIGRRPGAHCDRRRCFAINPLQIT